MNTTTKTLLATSVALTMGAASANIFNTPAFPTVDTHTGDSVMFFDNAIGASDAAYTALMDAGFTDNDIGAVIDHLEINSEAEAYTLFADIVSNDHVLTFDEAVGINDQFGLFGDDAYDDGDSFGLDIESSNDWYKQGSGSSDLGNGYSFSLGYGQTDVSLVGHFTDSTPDPVDSSGSMELYSEQVTNVTVGVSKVVWSDSDEAIVVGANYGTESNLSVGTSYQKNIMVGKGMIQAGVSAGHNVDSGITGFGYMAGYDAGVQAVGFDGIYGGFSLTDGLMTVGIVDVDTDGTRHNLTLNPIGILINLLMGNDTVFNHNFNK